jgi:hypothetical protein
MTSPLSALVKALEDSTEWFEQMTLLVGRRLDDTTAKHMALQAKRNRKALSLARSLDAEGCTGAHKDD